MSEALNIITGWPTGFYTVLLGVALLYWLLAMFGLIDVDQHGLHLPDHGHIEWHGNGHADADDLPTLASYAVAFGLTGVPLSIVLTLLLLFAWTITALTAQYLLPLLSPGTLRALFGLIVLPLALLPAIFMTALFSRPLRRLFVHHPAPSNESLVGERCRVLTLKVTDRFGQGEVASRGAPYNIMISASHPNRLGKGSMALIVSYDPATRRYRVQPDEEE